MCNEFVQNICEVLDERWQVDVVYLYFQKAFNHINYYELLSKLNYFRISSNLIRLLESYLIENMFIIKAINSPIWFIHHLVYLRDQTQTHFSFYYLLMILQTLLIAIKYFMVIILKYFLVSIRGKIVIEHKEILFELWNGDHLTIFT